MSRASLLFLLLLTSLVSNAEQISLEEFVRHDDYLNVTISPDGKHLAAQMRKDDQVVVAFLRLKDNKIISGVRPGEKNELHQVRWVNNERVVYTFAEKLHYLDTPIAQGELYATNIDGTQKQIIYGFRASDKKLGTRISKRENSFATPEILSVLEDDDKHILILEHPWSNIDGFWYDNRAKSSVISKLNVYSGKKRKIETLPYPGARAYADKKGNVQFISWRNEKAQINAAFRKNAEAPWKELTSVFDVNTSFSPKLVNADSSKAYLVGHYGPEKFRNLYELDLESRAIEPLFTDINADVTDWTIDPQLNIPAVAAVYPDKPQYHYMETENFLKSVHKKLASAFKPQEVNITSVTRDGKLVIAHVKSDINPGEFYLFDTQTNNAEFLMANQSWIDPNLMLPTEPISVKTGDGVTIHGYLTRAANKKAPLVVVLHGGPHGVRDYWRFNNEVQLFANRGYSVLQINYRGSDGYGKSFERLGYRQWGGRMVDDIVTAVKSVANAEGIDKNKICVYGASYGGYAALMSTVKAPDLFRCAIGYVGVYDLTIMYDKGDIKHYWGGIGYLERVIGRDEAELKEYSPVYHANKISANIMLAHGGEDDRAPLVHAKRMKKALEKAGKEVDWKVYRRSGHGVWDTKSRLKLYDGILSFLDKNIGQN